MIVIPTIGVIIVLGGGGLSTGTIGGLIIVEA